MCDRCLCRLGEFFFSFGPVSTLPLYENACIIDRLRLGYPKPPSPSPEQTGRFASVVLAHELKLAQHCRTRSSQRWSERSLSCSEALLTDDPRELPTHVCALTLGDSVTRHAVRYDIELPEGMPLPVGQHVISGQRMASPVPYRGEDGAWAGLIVHREVGGGTVTLFGLVRESRPWQSRNLVEHVGNDDPARDDVLDMLDDDRPHTYTFVTPRTEMHAHGDYSLLARTAEDLDAWYGSVLLGQTVVVTRGRPRGWSDESKAAYEAAVFECKKDEVDASDQNIATRMGMVLGELVSRQTVGYHRHTLGDVRAPNVLLRLQTP